MWQLKSTIFWIYIFLQRHLKCTSSDRQGWTEHMSAIARKGESFFFKMPTRERGWWYVWETELRFPPKSRLCVMDDSVQWAGWASVGGWGVWGMATPTPLPTSISGQGARTKSKGEQGLWKWDDTTHVGCVDAGMQICFWTSCQFHINNFVHTMNIQRY